MKQEEKMKGALGEWLEKSGKVIEVFRPLTSSLIHQTSNKFNPLKRLGNGKS